MSRSLLLIALLSLPLAAQEMRGARSGDWVPASERGCIGGTTCAERRLRVPLQDRPVVAVRFRAHDQVGQKADGSLRVKIDGNTVSSSIDVPRRGELFTIEVDELRGRYLVIEPASDDEVEVSEIAVLYGRDAGRDRGRDQGRIPRDPDWDRGRNDRAGGGWQSYPRAGACIGGNECGKNGDRITIALDRRPVLGVRFHAHDSIGQRADGKLSVRIDETTIGWYIDVQRNGKRHDIDVDNIVGSKLVIEAESEDEVEIKDIEVLYGRGGGRARGSRGPREVTHEGGCIGGDECGGRRNRIRIELDGRAVESLRFYARDDVGTRAKGELRIRIDEEILQYALDIPREGRTFTIDGEGHAGEYLYIEATEDDEVVLRDIRVRFADDED